MATAIVFFVWLTVAVAIGMACAIAVAFGIWVGNRLVVASRVAALVAEREAPRAGVKRLNAPLTLGVISRRGEPRHGEREVPFRHRSIST